MLFRSYCNRPFVPDSHTFLEVLETILLLLELFDEEGPELELPLSESELLGLLLGLLEPLEPLELLLEEGIFTVTVQLATNFPSSVVAVIVAVPVLTAVTTPLFTVAILVLSLCHFTF